MKILLQQGGRWSHMGRIKGTSWQIPRTPSARPNMAFWLHCPLRGNLELGSAAVMIKSPPLSRGTELGSSLLAASSKCIHSWVQGYGVRHHQSTGELRIYTVRVNAVWWKWFSGAILFGTTSIRAPDWKNFIVFSHLLSFLTFRPTMLTSFKKIFVFFLICNN